MRETCWLACWDEVACSNLISSRYIESKEVRDLRRYDAEEKQVGKQEEKIHLGVSTVTKSSL